MKYYKFLRIHNENMKATLLISSFVYLPLLLNQFHDCAGADFTAKEATQG